MAPAIRNVAGAPAADLYHAAEPLRKAFGAIKESGMLTQYHPKEPREFMINEAKAFDIVNAPLRMIDLTDNPKLLDKFKKEMIDFRYNEAARKVLSGEAKSIQQAVDMQQLEDAGKDIRAVIAMQARNLTQDKRKAPMSDDDDEIEPSAKRVSTRKDAADLTVATNHSHDAFAPANSNPKKLKQVLATANCKEPLENGKLKLRLEGSSKPKPPLPQPLKPTTMQPVTQKKRSTKRKATDPPSDEPPVSSSSADTPPLPQMLDEQIDRFIADMRLNTPNLIQTEEQAAAWREHFAAGPPQYRRKNQAGEFNSDASRKRLRVSSPPSSPSQRIMQAIGNLSSAVPGLRDDIVGQVDAQKRIAEGKELWSSKLLLNLSAGVVKPVKLVDSLMDQSGMTRRDADNFVQGGKLLNGDGNPTNLNSADSFEHDSSGGVGASEEGREEAQVGEDGSSTTITLPVRAKTHPRRFRCRDRLEPKPHGNYSRVPSPERAKLFVYGGIDSMDEIAENTREEQAKKKREGDAYQDPHFDTTDDDCNMLMETFGDVII